MIAPKLLTVLFFIQLGDAHAIRVGWLFLCHDVHGHLGEVQVGTDADRGSDACFPDHIADHPQRHVVRHRHTRRLGIFSVKSQIGSDVQKAFVNGVNVDVLRCHIAQIDGIDLRGDALILRHARHSHDAADLGVVLHLIQPDGLLRLKQPGTTRHANGLQRGGHGQANGLIRAALVRHQQVGGQRVEPTVNTFY